MRFRLVLAIAFVSLLLSCEKNTSIPSEKDCLRLCRHLDSLAAVEGLDSVLAVTPVALAACSSATFSEDSLRVAILNHALKACQIAKNMELMRSYSDLLLAIESARHGSNHPLTMPAKCWVADAMYRRGEFAAAESLLVHILSVLEPVKGEYAETYISSLILLVPVYAEQGRLDEGEALAAYGREEADRLLGPEHESSIMLRHRFTAMLRNQGRYREALELLERNLERLIPPLTRADSVELSTVFQSFGDTWKAQGKYAEAEQMYRRSIDLENGLYGENAVLDVPYFVLAELLLDEGREKEAERYFRQALEIRLAKHGPDHPGIAHTLTAMGMLYLNMSRYAEAERVLEEAIRIFTPIHGRDGLRTSAPLTRLGLVKLAVGKVVEAEAYLRHALEIRKRTLDSTHQLIGFGQWALAQVEAAKGNFEVARELYRESLAILQLRYGPVHQATFEVMRQLAVMEVQAGRIDESRIRFVDMRSRFRDCVRYIFSFTSETNKLCWIRKYPLLDQALLTIMLMNPSADWMKLAYEMVLFGKSAVLDAVAAERLSAFCSDDPIVGRLREERAVVCDDIAGLALGGFPGDSPTAREDSLALLFACQDSLEEELSRMCSSYHTAQPEVRMDADNIAAVLGDSTVLWDFVRYHPYDLSLAFLQEQPADSPRYLAFVVGGGGIEGVVDLGCAERVDSLVRVARRAIDRARTAIYQPDRGLHEESRLRETTGRLYAAIFAPLAETLAGRSIIRVSPDGALNLVPMDILPLPDGCYVAEEYCISYVTSGRDLVSMPKSAPVWGEAVVFADADFDYSDANGSSRHRDRRNERRFGADCLTHPFPLLPGTRREGEIIGSITREHGWSVREYYGGEASEGRFKRLDGSPVILHMATHGFFCSPGRPGDETVVENPLLRSGLVLAGANVSSAESSDVRGMVDDGFLTALEISATDLTNADLVVLSSCESGLGDVTDGEGVFGLRRAFRQANCRTLISSLWAVPDREAADLMASFYRRWLNGTPKGKALHEAALKQLGRSRERYGHGHPALWSGFLLVGSPE